MDHTQQSDTRWPTTSSVWQEQRPTTSILSRSRRWGRRLLFLLLCFFATAWLLLRLLFWWVGTQIPDLRNLAHYHPWRISQMYDADGTLIREMADQRRRPVALSEIPTMLRKAIVAAEDADFYRHEGLDYTGILRALWKNLWRRPGQPKQGGSTITQQVVKTFLLSPEQTYSRKLKEAVLAQKLEQSLKKDEILYLYLNQIYMGRGCYGIGEASRYYFNKPVSALTLGESAILAGIPKNPSRYNPVYSIADTTRRRNYVLLQMYKNGYISLATYTSEKSKPILPPRTSQPPPFQHDDFTNVAVEEARKHLLSQVSKTDLVNPQKRRQQLHAWVYQKGIQVETTLHPRAQRLARSLLQRGLTAIERRMNWQGPRLQGAWVALEPHTRRVIALLDGRDHQSHGPGRATQALHEPGTMLLPFFYGVAFDNRNYTLASQIPCPSTTTSPSHQHTTKDSLQPCFPLSLRKAWETEAITAPRYLVEHLGLQAILPLFLSLGLQPTLPGLQPSPDLLVRGQYPVSLWDLTNAYATLIVQGAYDSPTQISRIQTHDHRTLYERLPDPQRKLSPGASYLLLDMLQRFHHNQATDSPFPYTIAGKGTITSDRRSAWWVGCTSTLCTGIWLGWDDAAYAFPARESVSTLLLPLALSWFREYLQDKQGKPLTLPPFFRSEDVISISIDPQTGLRLSPHHPNATQEWFLYGTHPSQYSPLEVR